MLDNCDPHYKDKATYTDNLTLVDGGGRLRFRISGFNNCESIGSSHMVVADRAESCIWAVENVARRIRGFDRNGKETGAILNASSSAVAVDPETGNI